MVRGFAAFSTGLLVLLWGLSTLNFTDHVKDTHFPLASFCYSSLHKNLSERGSMPPTISQNIGQLLELLLCHPNVLKLTMVPSSPWYLLSNARI